MAIELPVQKMCYKGIYTIVGEIIIPNSLDLSIHPTDPDGLYFQNVPGKTIIICRNRSLTEDWFARVASGLSVSEPPDVLATVMPAAVTVAANSVNILGPFSEIFGNLAHVIRLQVSGTANPSDVDVAAVEFPY